MRHLFKRSLKVKILGLVLALILLIICIMTATFIFMEYKKDISNAENSALQAARTLSYMPNIQRAAVSNMDSEGEYVFEKIAEETGATNIILENKNGLVYSNAFGDMSDAVISGNFSYQAYIFGNSYVKDVNLQDKTLLLGIAPISIDYGPYHKIEGTILVIFDKDEIIKNIFLDVKNILIIAFIVLVVGIIGGIILANSIRKDTLGLEPIEIASLYKQRNAILHSIKEGIIAIDSTIHIAMMNNSAKQILGIKGKMKGKPLAEVFHNPEITNIIMSPKQISDVEIQYNGKTIIVNTMPIIEGKGQIGIVASFRDKTEIKNMINTISEVKQYSEDLRAQTHEFTNKLYVLLGLLQLGKYEDAMDFIQEVAQIQELNSDIIFNHIQDEKVQAILLGKLAKASEQKLEFIIDSNSSLEKLPEKFELVPLLIIIGNLIDNAFEAAADASSGIVTFFTTDIGNDIVFEVSDNGEGIDNNVLEDIFEKGLSEKGRNRGYGLWNVKHELELLGGFIEIDTSEEGTRFSVFLPKVKN